MAKKGTTQPETVVAEQPNVTKKRAKKEIRLCVVRNDGLGFATKTNYPNTRAAIKAAEEQAGDGETTMVVAHLGPQFSVIRETKPVAKVRFF